jgi:hypothetical protein
MSLVHSFSFRQQEKKFEFRSVDEHKWIYSAKMLNHMFDDYPVYVEMGGLQGVARALRTEVAGTYVA